LRPASIISTPANKTNTGESLLNSEAKPLLERTLSKVSGSHFSSCGRHWRCFILGPQVMRLTWIALADKYAAAASASSVSPLRINHPKVDRGSWNILGHWNPWNMGQSSHGQDLPPAWCGGNGQDSRTRYWFVFLSFLYGFELPTLDVFPHKSSCTSSAYLPLLYGLELAMPFPHELTCTSSMHSTQLCLICSLTN
jgi:hypothetical protein